MKLVFTRIASSALLLAAFCASHAAEPAGTDPSVTNGAATFQRYCVLCHGERGDGNGVAAKVYTTRPADLTASTQTDEYKTTIIRDGGEAVGRSASMPPWGKELSDAQIRDVVAYLKTIKTSKTDKSKAKPSGK
jgi:mono/diheme cytochrome c family protein